MGLMGPGLPIHHSNTVLSRAPHPTPSLCRCGSQAPFLINILPGAHQAHSIGDGDGDSTSLGGRDHQWLRPGSIGFFQQAAALAALRVPHIIQPGGEHPSTSPPFPFLSSGTLDMSVYVGERWPPPPSNQPSNPYCS